MTYLEIPETMGELRSELAHFGVKGMQWGVRRDRKSTPRQQRRTDRNDRIDTARGRVASGQSARERKEAKTEFKTRKRLAKANVPDRAKRRELNRVARRDWKIAKEKYNNDVYTAQLTKSGAETAIAILGVAGGAAIGAINAGGLASRPSTGFAPSSQPRAPIRVQAHVGSPRF